jgi:hypothetical protein
MPIRIKGTEMLNYLYAYWARLKLYALPVLEFIDRYKPRIKRVYDLIYSRETCLQG